MRSSWLLFALLALVALSAAFSVEEALNVDGINAYLHHGVKKRADGTGVSSSEPAASTTETPEPSSTDTPSSTAAPSSTPAPSSSADSTPDESTSAPASTSQTDRTSSQPASTTQAPATSKTSSKVTSAVVTTKPLVSTEITPTTTVYTIISNGQTVESTSVGSKTVEHTTGTSTETTLPTTGAENSSGSHGLSSTKKSIIGGVVGGVGGAILLGGIAVVCWRMWGRKKRVTEDDADLMAGTGSALGDKSHNNTSPFQSNLEQYHNPGGRPNAAANF